VRAFELAGVNVANRPTLRAFEQAYATAGGVGDTHAASEILAAAGKRWGSTAAFGLSRLAPYRNNSVNNEAETFDNSPWLPSNKFRNDPVLTLSTIHSVNRKSYGAAT
jgi:hypothetical protein